MRARQQPVRRFRPVSAGEPLRPLPRGARAAVRITEELSVNIGGSIYNTIVNPRLDKLTSGSSFLFSM